MKLQLLISISIALSFFMYFSASILRNHFVGYPACYYGPHYNQRRCDLDSYRNIVSDHFTQHYKNSTSKNRRYRTQLIFIYVCIAPHLAIYSHEVIYRNIDYKKKKKSFFVKWYVVDKLIPTEGNHICDQIAYPCYHRIYKGLSENNVF